ncbi:hypothetical protein TNCV_409871 [Trichonephila clavipes]|nr:hypothetical protein TNCV_409871 [Trichonephila clavipes]
MALNSGSVSRGMVTSSRKIFCCSVPLTTMRPPRPIWLTLPLTQKGRFPTVHSWVTGRVLDEDVHVRGSHFVGCGAEPGMIHRDHCHRWESWQWRVQWALACPGDETRWQNKRVAWCFM